MIVETSLKESFDYDLEDAPRKMPINCFEHRATHGSRGFGNALLLEWDELWSRRRFSGGFRFFLFTHRAAKLRRPSL